MARGFIGALGSIDPDAYNKGVKDAIDLRNMQRAETARRIAAREPKATATPVEDYKNPFAGLPLQDQNKLMPDPRAGGQYMTIPGSEQDKMLEEQDGNVLSPRVQSQVQKDAYEANLKRNLGLLNQSNLANARNAYSNDPNFFTPNFDPSTITVTDSTRFPVKRPNIQNVTDNIYEVDSSGGQKIYQVGPGTTIGGKQFKKTKITPSNIDAINEFINRSNKQFNFRGDNTRYLIDNTAGKKGQALLDALEGVPYTPEVAEQMSNIQASMQGLVLDRNADDIGASLGLNTTTSSGDVDTKDTSSQVSPQFKTQTGNTGNYGKATANLSTLKDNGGIQTNPQLTLAGDTGVVGEAIRDEEIKILGDAVTKPKFRTQKLIDNRKFIVDKINRARNQGAQYNRLADIYRSVGDIANYTNYLSLASQSFDGAADLRNSLIEYDDTITLSIAKDALEDLSVSNNSARVAQILSKYTSQNIEIIPNSYDNNFTLLVNGQVREVLDRISIEDKLRSITDKAYFDFKIKNQRERAMEEFKKGLTKEVEILKIEGQIKKEAITTEGKIILEKIKQSNMEFKSNGDGTGFIMRNGRLYKYNPYRQDPLDENKTEPGFEEMRLELEGSNANAYEAGFAED